MIQTYKQGVGSPLLAVSKEVEPQPAQNADTPKMTVPNVPHSQRITCWSMTFYYSPDQEESVRQIFQECQFMRIVRKLDSIGIKAAIQKAGA